MTREHEEEVDRAFDEGQNSMMRSIREARRERDEARAERDQHAKALATIHAQARAEREGLLADADFEVAACRIERDEAREHVRALQTEREKCQEWRSCCCARYVEEIRSLTVERDAARLPEAERADLWGMIADRDRRFSRAREALKVADENVCGGCEPALADLAKILGTGETT